MMTMKRRQHWVVDPKLNTMMMTICKMTRTALLFVNYKVVSVTGTMMDDWY